MGTYCYLTCKGLLLVPGKKLQGNETFLVTEHVTPIKGPFSSKVRVENYAANSFIHSLLKECTGWSPYFLFLVFAIHQTLYRLLISEKAN